MRGDQDDPNPLQQRDDHNPYYGQVEPAGYNTEREHRPGKAANPPERRPPQDEARARRRCATTRFTSNGGSRMEGLIPEAYAPFAQPIFAAFAQPAAVTAESDVAEVVWRCSISR